MKNQLLKFPQMISCIIQAIKFCMQLNTFVFCINYLVERQLNKLVR